MSVSILVVDDEPDVADLFRQRRRSSTAAVTPTATQPNGAHTATPKATCTGSTSRTAAREFQPRTAAPGPPGPYVEITLLTEREAFGTGGLRAW